MPGRHIIAAIAGSALIASSAVRAQEELKVGIVMPLTGTFAPVGKQIVAAAQLYMQQNGDLVAGRKIRLVVADDRGIAENSKRLTQDLVSNQKASVIGAAISPGALAMAPLVTDAKIATVLMVAAASTVIQRSPYFVRTKPRASIRPHILPQLTRRMWRRRKGREPSAARTIFRLAAMMACI
jgi:branched-chain amino acid transport system substrate-binding protein